MIILFNILKNIHKKKSIWEQTSTIMHLYKMISNFYKNFFKKLRAMLLLIDSAPPINKPTTKSMTKLLNAIKIKHG